MSRRVRCMIRLGLGFFVLCVAVLASVCFLFDTIMREIMIRRVEAATGMRTTIGAVHVGLRSGTVTIRDFRLYNRPEFGNALCLDMPELHLEVDQAGLTSGQLHLKLVRLDLARVVLVVDKKGRSNFGALEPPVATHSTTNGISVRGFKFTGIDTLDLSLGTLQTRNLADGRETRVPFDIHHQIFHHVKSEADIALLGITLALRGGSSHPNNNGVLGNLLDALKLH